MAGGSSEHSILGANVLFLLGLEVRNGKVKAMQQTHCNVHTSDLQIFISGLNRYLYPDSAIVCGKPTRDSRVKSAITNPVVIVEVVSPSSISYDTGIKFDYYSSLASLRDYVLVHQDDTLVEVRSRTEAGGRWNIAFAKTLYGVAHLPSISVDLPLAEAYRGINFVETTPLPNTSITA